MFRQIEKEITNNYSHILGPGHDLEHFRQVLNHATKALEKENLPLRLKYIIQLAAFLHDVDDKKMVKQQIPYQNACLLVSPLLSPDEAELMILLIKLVSCSENYVASESEIISLLKKCNFGDVLDAPRNWIYLVRDCDRLEAIGEIGINRCVDYAMHIGNPFHTDKTPRCSTQEELDAICSEEKYQLYQKGMKSKSVIDHFYEKLLHIGKDVYLESQNSYILSEAAQRRKCMSDYVLDYWKKCEIAYTTGSLF